MVLLISLLAQGYYFNHKYIKNKNKCILEYIILQALCISGQELPNMQMPNPL